MNGFIGQRKEIMIRLRSKQVSVGQRKKVPNLILSRWVGTVRTECKDRRGV